MSQKKMPVEDSSFHIGPRVGRRAVLAGATAIGALGLTGLGAPRSAAATPYDTLRARWVDQLTGGDVDPTNPLYAQQIAAVQQKATGVLRTMITSPDRTVLWDDLPIAGPTIVNVAGSYGRLNSIALAWATPGTSQYHDDDLATDLGSALQLLGDLGYNTSMEMADNSWFWTTGIPRQLADLCCLLYDHIDTADRTNYMAAVQHFMPDPNGNPATPSTGANRSDHALATVLRGILTDDSATIATGRDALSDVRGGGKNSLFAYVTTDDGFYADGSFIQHHYLPYVGTYGNVALSGVTALLALLGGSDWEITDPNKAVLLDAIDKSFAPFIRNGHMMDTVRGRAVSREREPDTKDAFTTISSILLLAEGVGEPYRSRYRSMAKGWIQRCADASYLDTAALPSLRLAIEAIDNDSVPAAAQPNGVVQFPAQERTVCHGSGWAFTVSTSSKRIGRYEWLNRENTLGWYQGDGMTYLYRDDDISHFTDNYWPTVDPYRLPGITSSDAPRTSGVASNGVPRASQTWAGGVALGGKFAAIGMDHLNNESQVAAKKSWFVIEDRVVAMGAGITGTGGHRVFTIIENRNQCAGGGRLIVDRREIVDKIGDAVEVRNPHCLFLEKFGGVTLPAGGTVQIARNSRTGSWYDINSASDTGGSKDEVTRNYLTLWIDHGIDPTDETYCYQLLPGAGSAAEAAKAARLNLLVLANTPTVQAIRVPARRLWMANFFQAGSAGGIVSDGPVSVAFQSIAGRTSIAISDPSRTTNAVTLTLPMVDATTVISADQGIDVVNLAPLRVRVATSGGVPVNLTVTD